MEFRPILSAMRRNKVGAILIAVQMAITLAILCNGLFIIEQRITLSKRPTGADEANVFVVDNQWVGNPPDIAARLQADLAMLRSLPGVVDAIATNSFPLSGGGSTDGIKLDPDQKDESASSALYLVDEHGVQALGLKLIAGRNFNADEVMDLRGYTDRTPAVCRHHHRALAEKLFPGQNALGRSIFSVGQKSTIPIVGIVDRLQVPWVGASGWGSKFNDNSMLVPYHFLSTYTHYIVRTQPGQLAAALQAAQKKLFEVNRGRVLQRTESLTEARKKAYQDDMDWRSFWAWSARPWWRSPRSASSVSRAIGWRSVAARSASAARWAPAQCHHPILPDREFHDRRGGRRGRGRAGGVVESVDGQCL